MGGAGEGLLEDDLKRVEELDNPLRPRKLPERVPNTKLPACRPTPGRELARVGAVHVEVDPTRPDTLCSARGGRERSLIQMVQLSWTRKQNQNLQRVLTPISAMSRSPSIRMATRPLLEVIAVGLAWTSSVSVYLSSPSW